MSSEALARLALSRVIGIGAKLFRALIEELGTAKAVFAATDLELARVRGIGADSIAALRKSDPHREAEAIVLFAEANEVDILCLGEANYPEALSRFSEAPPILYHRGNTDFTNPRSVAIVGTRTMSARGEQQIERLLNPLRSTGALIVSGLAYGADIAAHRRALELGLPTLGVIGSGLQYLYPNLHRRIARQMVGAGGGILTEYPHWIKPEREHFPCRNKIVAMLSDLTVVVESKRKGGSMITADFASRYGKLVGACPGRGLDERSTGCNYLIKKGRAHMVENGQDIIDLLEWNHGPEPARQGQLFLKLPPKEHRLVEQLQAYEATSLDQLGQVLSEPTARLAKTMLKLEMKGMVTALPGNRYRLS